MEISRHGTYRPDKGSTSIQFHYPYASWDEKQKAVVLRERGIRNFSGDQQHDYRIELTLPDLEKIVKTLGEDAVSKSPAAVKKSFEPLLKSLVRILAVATGTKMTSRKKKLI